MEYNRVNLIYFSATSTTKKIVRYIAEGTGVPEINCFDITRGWTEPVAFGPEEIVIIGMPVYAGRIPSVAAESLRRFTGNRTPTMVVCVYGNRDFDDALLELKNRVESGGFDIVSAAAFIGQHAIFPEVGKGRPDEEDKKTAINFGKESYSRIKVISSSDALFPSLSVKGNFPYKPAKSIPLVPRASRKCDACGACVRLCPVSAIHETHPRKTDKTRCIACGRCVTICPRHARHFGGILYALVSRKFVKNFSVRKEPYLIYSL